MDWWTRFWDELWMELLFPIGNNTCEWRRISNGWRKKEFYEEEEQKIDLNEDWFIYSSYETELALEYESEGDFDKSKLKWNKDGEGGLEYENEDCIDFEDVSGGESNGDEESIWKITVKGFDYEGEW